MKYLLSILLIFGCVVTSSAQVVISGQARDAKTREAVAGVNVMLQDVQQRVMYGYSISDDKGAYSITYKGQADSLQVVVTGFNIKQKSRAIAARSQRIDFLPNPVDQKTLAVKKPCDKLLAVLYVLVQLFPECIFPPVPFFIAGS